MKVPVKSFIIVLLIIISFSCRKEQFTNSKSSLLSFSTDSLHFDTVFTTTGSFSQLVKVYNNNDKAVHIQSIKLATGATSSFKINADGIPGPLISNIDIQSSDSIYIFVTLNIPSNNQAVPFIISDSIEIDYNNNRQFIQLEGFGQNAHFNTNRIIKGNEVWSNDLPYIIIGKITIDTNATLTINEGCRVYMHADAPFIINGQLIVNGSDTNRVLFTGDRLDEPYKNFPASYPGLIFNKTSDNNIISYAIINNAYQAIVISSPSAGGNKLTLNQTIINNAYDAGLLASNTSISASNLLISNCGKDLELLNGGNYKFSQCTIAAYSNFYVQHKDPALQLSNYLDQTSNQLNATFTNCIIWGENNGLLPTEVAVYKNNALAFNVIFDHVLWRVDQSPPNAQVIAPLISNPLFDSINTNQNIYNLHLKDNSPAIHAGISSNVLIDLDGQARNASMPSLGSYEK